MTTAPSTTHNDVEPQHRSRAEMDHLHSPSRWTKRLSPDVIVDKHIEVASSGHFRARK